MRRDGFTLIELIFAVSLLTVAVGALFGLAVGVKQVADAQEAAVQSQEEAGKALQRIVREIAGAAQATVTGVPGPAVSFQSVADTDGNGVALDKAGKVELSAARTIRRETGDENADGVANGQLLLFKGDAVRVLCNGLAPNEDINGNGTLEPGEDANGNGRLDRGVWFEPTNQGIRITVDTQCADERGHWFTSTLSQDVRPRN